MLYMLGSYVCQPMSLWLPFLSLWLHLPLSSLTMKAVESYHKPWEPALTWQIQNCLLTLEQLSFGCCTTWEVNRKIEDLSIIFLSMQQPLQ